MDRKGGGSRKIFVSGKASGGGVFKRGAGIGSGKPVGDASGYSDRRQGTGGPIGGTRGSGSGGFNIPFARGAGSRGCGLSMGKLILIILAVIAAVYLYRSCAGQETIPSDEPTAAPGEPSAPRIEDVTGDPSHNDISPATGITGPRTARTVIRGGGRDVFTIMVYMCGTDLESGYGMATADLNEMLYADLSDSVNIVVETGGAKKWKNSVIKNTTNQRYRVADEGLQLLDGSVGKKPMTDPGTLTDFIEFCAENYPANRYALILWDHGGGSLGGYGYDELFPNSGSMGITQINGALEAADVDFDFVGFDACLMATLETAYMLNYHADYMIASEETEPGIGWYYTGWLTALSADPSMPTVEIGQRIIDDFVEKCGEAGAGETATLSLIDLVRLNNVADGAFREFAASASLQLDTDYKVISNARGSSREFNRSDLDQVDLIDLANHIGTPEARTLAAALAHCVRYNKTSANITKAYGVSIYFPYDELKNLSAMLPVYDRIGMGSEYSALVRKFANMVVGGQITTSGSGNALGSLLGTSGLPSSGDLWSLAWNTFFSEADFSGFTGGLPEGQSSWIDQGFIEGNADFFKSNYLDANSLVLTQKGGTQVLSLTGEQWDLIQKVELNVFVDDGEGYIDLGLDNVYEFDGDGDLVVDFSGTWLALDGHVAAYYLETAEESGGVWSITGRIPALINGRRADIMVKFDNDHPSGIVLGARFDYGEATSAVAKGLVRIEAGDAIDFLCDYYTYDEEFSDSYMLGEPMTSDGLLTVSNVELGDIRCKVTYRLTDIYNNTYWTPAVDYGG